MSHYQPWTHHDDECLRFYWGTTSINTMCRKLERTRFAIVQRAHVLKLGGAVPEGMEYLTHAARRTGYYPNTLRMILRWAGSPLLEAYSKGGKQRWIVDGYLVDEAIREWHETETIAGAARRLDVDRHALYRALVASGVQMERGVRRVGPGGKRHFRVRTADIDRVWREKSEAA